MKFVRKTSRRKQLTIIERKTTTTTTTRFRRLRNLTLRVFCFFFSPEQEEEGREGDETRKRNAF